MDDQTKIALAAAVVGGYVLGRTKKGKLALSVGTYLAGGRFGLDPRQLAAEGMRRLGELPQVAELQEQTKGEFADADRKAVTAAATRGVGALTGTLRDRAAGLGKGEEEEEANEKPDENAEAKKAAPAKKSSATKPAAEKASRAKKSDARKQAPSKKAASSGRAAKKMSKLADRRR
ncbi:hypothetical protein ABZY45_22025 [Streptomyces sp. NPDC006516]|uniref:hypothetical protein n=1 Tax=Streptomyces sp. NPDC006516 TaxID=3154309 RepID=UPI0033AD66B5